MYHQQAYEKFQEGLDFIKGFKAVQESKSVDRLRVKFTCKLYEGIGHLMCEPLLFDKCEELLDKAEQLYDDNEPFFTQFDRFRFLIKKSSFLKKFGFFHDALDILSVMQRELMDILKAPKDLKDTFAAKKLLFKVHRDQARLYALRREEQKAHDAHRKAERILKEELVPNANK